MKKSEYDFAVPNRQSYVAIILILYKTVNIVFRQLIPILLVILIGGAKNKVDYVLYTVIGVSVVTTVYAIINFFRTYFIIENNELVLYTGVLNRKKTSIPFGKIQTINFEQNITHRFFEVVRLKVDTAGSDKNEFEFQALEVEKAHALRDLVLEDKKSINTHTIEEKRSEKTVSFKPIMALGPKALLKVGITQNHIRSLGLIFVFFFWIYQNLKEVGVDVDGYSEDLPDVDFDPTILFVMAILFLVFAIGISLVQTLIKYYDLQFLRSPRGFKVVSGLFTKKEVSALDHKIQFIGWSENVLEKIVRYKTLSLNQASSAQITSKQKIQIPGINEVQVQNVVNTLFGEVDLAGLAMHAIDKRYFYRFATIISVMAVAIIGLSYYLDIWNQVWVVLFIFILMTINRYLAYRKKSYGYNEELLYIKGGVFGEKSQVLPIYKIQALEIDQNPYQIRKKLCNLTVFTAAGNVRIPYIGSENGKALLDLFMHKVEVDHRNWM